MAKPTEIKSKFKYYWLPVILGLLGIIPILIGYFVFRKSEPIIAGRILKIGFIVFGIRLLLGIILVLSGAFSSSYYY